MELGFSHCKVQLIRLEVIQNQGMRTTLGCTRDTLCEAMCHVLDILSMPERHVMRAPVQAYLKVCSGEKHPQYDKVGREVRSRLKRGTLGRDYHEWTKEAVSLDIELLIEEN